MGPDLARHRRRRPLHEQHARDRSRYREGHLVPPVHPRRITRHGRGVRERPRSTAAAADRSTRWASWGFCGSSIGATGRFISAHDLGYQTLVDVNTTTGKVTYRPGMLPKPGVEIEFCPDIQGVRGWHAMSYDPGTGALLIPIHPACQTGGVLRPASNLKTSPNPPSTATIPRYNGYRGGPSSRHPKMPDHAGELIAMDVDTGRVRWQFPCAARHRSRR